MAKKIASDIRFLYDGYDPGTSTVRASVTLESEVLDPTAMTDAAERAMAGSRKDVVEWGGLFDDASGDMDAAQAALLGAGTGVISLLIGTAMGDRAYSGTGFLLSAKDPAKLGGLVQQEVTLKPDQAMDRGETIRFRYAKTGTASFDDASAGTLDNGTATFNGGVLYYHLHTIDGNNVNIGLVHGVDGTGWDVAAQSGNISVVRSGRVTFTGTLNRYTYGRITGTGIGTATIIMVRN